MRGGMCCFRSVERTEYFAYAPHATRCNRHGTRVSQHFVVSCDYGKDAQWFRRQIFEKVRNRFVVAKCML